MGNHLAHLPWEQQVAAGPKVHSPAISQGPWTALSTGDVRGAKISKRPKTRIRLFCDAAGLNCESSDEWGGPARQKIEEPTEPVLQSLPVPDNSFESVVLIALRVGSQPRSSKTMTLLNFLWKIPEKEPSHLMRKRIFSPCKIRTKDTTSRGLCIFDTLSTAYCIWEHILRIGAPVSWSSLMMLVLHLARWVHWNEI